LDLVGSFKKAKGGFTHIFVAVDKFTKWIKAKPPTSIPVAKVVEFIREIMYQFGVPNNIITDNRTQFTTREFRDFCADAGIKINYVSISHLQSNEQAERINSMILQGLKPIIFYRHKVLCWEVDERVDIGPVGSAHDPESGHRAHIVFTSIRL
jgi:transposase InsO family protein